MRTSSATTAKPRPASPARAARIAEIKREGFARVHRDFPPHLQARLAFKASTDTDRKAAAQLIEEVKAEVDRVEAEILAGADVAAVKAAHSGLALPQ